MVTDIIKHPSHYVKGGIEAIQVIRAFFQGHKYYYELGNITKYVLRSPHKGKFVEDLKKAREYIDQILELEAAKELAPAEMEQQINDAFHKGGLPRVWQDVRDIPANTQYRCRKNDIWTRGETKHPNPDECNRRGAPFTEVL